MSDESTRIIHALGTTKGPCTCGDWRNGVIDPECVCWVAISDPSVVKLSTSLAPDSEATDE